MRDERITRLERRIAATKAKNAKLIDEADARGAERLTTAEDVEFRANVDELEKLNARLDELQEEEARDAGITESAAQVRRTARTSVREPGTYSKESRASYFQDIIKVQLGLDDTNESRGRLARHATDVVTNPEYRDLSRTDGSGGYFTPPAYLVADFAALARAGRVTANLVKTQALPPGTDNINIPLISTGTATAVQTADNAVVQETDLTDSTVSAPVRTIAGQQDVAIQLLDQSPVRFDEVIFADLMADYAAQVDKQVISGSNASGQVKGLLNASGIISVTYTDTAPSVTAFYRKLADAVQRVHTTRFLPPTVIIVHPRRWGWLEAASDGQNRPLVVPSGPGVNAVATANGPVSEGIVGNMMGLPVAVDPNIPTNLGSGTTKIGC